MLEKFQQILNNLPEKYRELLIEELNIVTDNNVADFLPYFLTLKEISDIAKSINALRGPGRGSAGGSLIAYLFGITDLDPIKYDLPLKRFISVSRLQRSVPDIDVDFPKGKRDEINKIIFERYGDRAAFVATFGMQKLKNSLLDAWRINMLQPTDLKIEKLKAEGKFDEAQHLKTTLEEHTEKFGIIRKSLGMCPVGFTDIEWLEGCTKDDEYHKGLLETNPAFKEWASQFPNVLETAKNILAIPRQMGMHAAGVVIADVPLHEIVPVMQVDGFNVIAYDKKTIQKLGLIKFDNLGLNTLNFIEDTIEKVKNGQGIKIEPWNLLDKPDVYKEFIDGNCRTLFQFDTIGGANFAKKMIPMVKKDLFAAVALNRPGALDAKIETRSGEIVAADAYIERMHGDLDVEYLHDDLKDILQDTYSVYVYQEQVSKTIQKLLGYSEEEADTIRGAISDKNPKAFEEIKKRLPMLIERGWTQAQADRLYDTLLAFARYSFNLSHSVGYGLIAYTTAYLKHFHPLEWWTSVLTHSTPDEVTEKYWPEIYHLIDEPNINTSKNKYEIHNGRIIPPLNLVDGVGVEALKEIFAKAPYSSLDDFMLRTSGRKVNKKVVIALIKSRVMNCLFDDPKSPMDVKVQAYLAAKSFREGKKPEPLPEEFKNLNPYKEFLLTKEVLPISSISLMDAVLNSKEIHKSFIDIDGKLFYKGTYPLYTGKKLNYYLEKAHELEQSIECVSYGYVIAVRNFQYYSEKYKMDKMALEVIMDFDGYQMKTVCWPRKADYQNILSKYIKEKTAYLFNIRIANHPNWKFNIIGVDVIKEIKNDKIQKSKEEVPNKG